MSYNLSEYVAHERKIQQIKLKEKYAFLTTKLEMVVEDGIATFLKNDRFHDRKYIMIMNIVSALSRRCSLTHAEIRRFCYIDADDIELFKKAEITQSIIWAVKHLFATRGATLHDVSDSKKSGQIVLQIVLAPNAPPIPEPPDLAAKKRKRAPHPSPSSPDYSPTSPTSSPPRYRPHY